MKILKIILGIILVLISLALISLGILTYYPQFKAEKKISDIENFGVKIEDIKVKDSKIIALGEATHGNIEFQELKLTLLKNLVINNGVKAFCLETDFGEGVLINRYIHGGENENIIDELSFKIYHTKQIRDLIEWMREYNSNVDDKDKLNFYGFDMQNPEANIEIIASYCEENAILKDVRKTLYPIIDSETSINDLKIDNAVNLLNNIKTDDPIINRAIKCVLASIEYYKTDFSDYIKANNVRDAYMADNVKWISDYENGPILISAHNGHVTKDTDIFDTMGSILYKEFENEYFVVGTDFYKTVANINDVGKDNTRGNYKFISANPLAYQAKYFSGSYYLDFSKVVDSSETYKFINSKIYTGTLGEGYSFLMNMLPWSYRIHKEVSLMYDAMIMIYETSPIETD